jgi:multidrug efflux pump subunit AcrA (membrane-fusion protein)
VTGKVSRVGFELHPQERGMRAEIDVPNPGGELRPNMLGMARLRFGTGPEDSVRVPARSVFRLPAERVVGEAKWGVYVYRDGKARLMAVRSDYDNGDEFEIRSGLTADDLVVADLHSLGSQGGRVDEIPVRGEPPRPSK